MSLAVLGVKGFCRHFGECLASLAPPLARLRQVLDFLVTRRPPLVQFLALLLLLVLLRSLPLLRVALTPQRIHLRPNSGQTRLFLHALFVGLRHTLFVVRRTR